MSYNAKVSYGQDSAVGFKMNFDDRQMQAKFAEMDQTAGSIMANAIKDVLRAAVPETQRKLNQANPRHRFMAQKVADSLIVEMGENEGGVAEVRFGSDPIDEGGVTGSRGGKLAAIMEYGMRSFEYPWTFKSIDNGGSWGPGGGFINAKTGNNMRHPGFKAVGWLSSTMERPPPKFEQAILDALNNAWGSKA